MQFTIPTTSLVGGSRRSSERQAEVFCQQCASEYTPISELLNVAFSRYRVERCFEDDKKHIGMDHYESRRYPGLIRHLIISSVAMLCLARMRGSLLAAYPELTVSQLYQATSALIQSWRLSPGDADKLLEHTASQISY